MRHGISNGISNKLNVTGNADCGSGEFCLQKSQKSGEYRKNYPLRVGRIPPKTATISINKKPTGGSRVKTAVLVMKRASLAQGLMKKLIADHELQLFYEPDYANADLAIRGHLADAALLEIAESGECDADYCLDLCGWLREVTPTCRLLIMCPETNSQAVQKVIRAKREHLIDDFVFYDVSMDYIVTNLRAL